MELGELLRAIDSASSPQRLADALRMLLEENPYMLSHGSPPWLRRAAPRLGPLAPLAANLLRRIGLRVVKRRAWRRLVHGFSTCNTLGVHIARLLDLLVEPGPWEELHRALDVEGKERLMAWLRAGAAALLIGPQAAIERYSGVSVDEFIEAEERLEKEKVGWLDVNGARFGVYRVRGRRGVYRIASQAFFILEAWVYENYPAPRGGVVIDAGAYAGETSIWFLDASRSDVKVYAIEPEETVLRLLEWNIKSNRLEGLVTPLNVWLGDRDAERVKRLDSLVGERIAGDVGYVKLDVEGWEESILKGAERVLREWKPVVAVAVYHRPRDPVRLYRLLAGLGYRRFTLRFRMPLYTDVVLVAHG